MAEGGPECGDRGMRWKGQGNVQNDSFKISRAVYDKLTAGNYIINIYSTIVPRCRARERLRCPVRGKMFGPHTSTGWPQPINQNHATGPMQSVPQNIGLVGSNVISIMEKNNFGFYPTQQQAPNFPTQQAPIQSPARHVILGEGFNLSAGQSGETNVGFFEWIMT